MPNINRQITLTSKGVNGGPIFDIYYSLDCAIYTICIDGSNVYLPNIGSTAIVTVPDNIACLKLINKNADCNNSEIEIIAPPSTTTSTTTTTCAPCLEYEIYRKGAGVASIQYIDCYGQLRSDAFNSGVLKLICANLIVSSTNMNINPKGNCKGLVCSGNTSSLDICDCVNTTVQINGTNNAAIYWLECQSGIAKEEKLSYFGTTTNTNCRVTGSLIVPQSISNLFTITKLGDCDCTTTTTSTTTTTTSTTTTTLSPCTSYVLVPTSGTGTASGTYCGTTDNYFQAFTSSIQTPCLNTGVTLNSATIVYEYPCVTTTTTTAAPTTTTTTTAAPTTTTTTVGTTTTSTTTLALQSDWTASNYDCGGGTLNDIGINSNFMGTLSGPSTFPLTSTLYGYKTNPNGINYGGTNTIQANVTTNLPGSGNCAVLRVVLNGVEPTPYETYFTTNPYPQVTGVPINPGDDVWVYVQCYPGACPGTTTTVAPTTTTTTTTAAPTTTSTTSTTTTTTTTTAGPACRQYVTYTNGNAGDGGCLEYYDCSNVYQTICVANEDGNKFFCALSGTVNQISGTGVNWSDQGPC